MNYGETIKNTSYTLFTLISVGWLLHIGQAIVLPVFYAMLFTIFLNPIDAWILKRVKVQAISIILSFIIVLLPIAIIGILFSYQLIDIAESLPSISNNIKKGADELFVQIKELIPFVDGTRNEFIRKNLSTIADESGGALKTGISSTTSIIIGFFLTFLYTFFFLYYRKSFRNFIVFQFDKENRSDTKKALKRIKDMVQSYIGGLGIVILVLSIMNSTGLWLIGVEYPIFWGTFAGILAIIPYVGTIVGGLLPFLYALATMDSFLPPALIVAYYAAVQVFEGNILTPKIVGNKININPLFAIISLLFFGSLWGVGGVILALPLISVIRIIFSNFEATKPIAILMSTNVDEKAGKFQEIADN